VNKEKEKSVYSVTLGILNQLDETREQPAVKATLANLRNTLGMSLWEASGAWPILFERLPESFISTYKEPSYEEHAIFTTLQLYAVHQQGKSDSVLETKGESWQNIGTSLRILRGGEQEKSVDHRMNTLVTSTTFEELSHHLRQMIQILKSKSDAKVNYPRLAEDLYWFLRGYEKEMRLRWSREYYRISKLQGESEDEK
jgi:CRISPR system Cascade subunit CasB